MYVPSHCVNHGYLNLWLRFFGLILYTVKARSAAVRRILCVGFLHTYGFINWPFATKICSFSPPPPSPSLPPPPLFFVFLFFVGFFCLFCLFDCCYPAVSPPPTDIYGYIDTCLDGDSFCFSVRYIRCAIFCRCCWSFVMFGIYLGVFF